MPARSLVPHVGEDRTVRRVSRAIAIRCKRPALVLTIGSLVAAAFVLAFQGAASANDDPPGGCSNWTLRGDYGILVSGVRALGPTVTETFIGTAIRTYDGRGNFEQIDNSHGTVTGAVTNTSGFGTYTVNANCSGTSTLLLPGAPPIETSFVIVDHGDEVKDIVMSPLPNLVTAVLTRVGR